jgi:hypothetical protein
MEHYDTQAIVCLAPDLLEAARGHEAKPVARGEAGNIGFRGGQVRRSALYVLGPQHVLPHEYCLPGSRLIIVSHGTPSSTEIIGGANGVRWSPEQLANAVISWLDSSVIRRIALKMCYAGGSRGGATRGAGEDLGDFMGRFTVDPRTSFAYQFARRCGFAQTITAQTGLSTTRRNFAGEVLTDVEELVDGTHQGHAYKIILTPVRGARPTAPQDPALAVSNPRA